MMESPAELDDFNWVRSRYPAAVSDAAQWNELLDWARGIARMRGAVVGRALAERGLTPRIQAAGNCYGDRACDWILRTDHAANQVGSWEQFRAAWVEVRPVVAALAATVARAEASIKQALGGGLEAQLQARFVRDQLLRAAYAGAPPLPLSTDGRHLLRLVVGMMVSRSDQENAAWLQELVETSGWPRPPEISREAEMAAWFMLVHSRHDPLLQLATLERMRVMAERGEVSAAQYATRLDHILFELTGLQRYGTRGECVGVRFVPLPSEDQVRLPQLRQEVGLPTLEEQGRLMNPACAAAEAPPPNGTASGSEADF